MSQVEIHYYLAFPISLSNICTFRISYFHLSSPHTPKMSSSENHISLENKELSSSSSYSVTIVATTSSSNEEDTSEFDHDDIATLTAYSNRDYSTGSSATSQEQGQRKIEHTRGELISLICGICIVVAIGLGFAGGLSYVLLEGPLSTRSYQCRLENSTMTMENATITHDYLLIGNETWRNASSINTIWHVVRLWNIDECDFSTSEDFAEQPLVQEIGIEQQCYYTNQDECQVTFTEPRHIPLALAIVLVSLLSLIGLVFVILYPIAFISDYRAGDWWWKTNP